MALALRDHGARLLAYSAASDEGRARAQQWLGGRASAGLAELVAADPDLYLLTVPDRALPAVAEQLGHALLRAHRSDGDASAGRDWKAVVAHTSGVTSVDVLDGCEKAGAATLAFHPLQTFSDPATGRARFAGAAVAITPGDPGPPSPAAELGFNLASALGAKPFLLPDDRRTLYHAAATVACNYLVTLEHQARRLFVASGLPDDEALSMFLPLVQATLGNIATQGTVPALTGPLSRGDTQTIAAHLASLRAHAPDLLPLYQAMGLATLDIVHARGEVGPELIAELSRLLKESSQPHEPGA
jgi:predicted short-subunit dehydrogenase-like oxidoreductase (DUF2520 family)